MDNQTNRFKGWLCMMGSKECSCVCLLLYLYFIIMTLDASGAMHATKEKPHNIAWIQRNSTNPCQ